MKKLAKTLTIAGAIASAGVVSTESTVQANTPDSAQLQQNSETDSVDTAQQNFNTAKNNLAHAEAGITDKKEQVSNISAAIDQKKADIESTANLVSQNTPDNIDKVAKDINDIKNNIDTASDTLQQKEQKQSILQQELSSTAYEADLAKQAVSNQNNVVSATQQQVQNAQNDLNSDSVANIQQAIAESTANAEKIKNDLSKANDYKVVLENNVTTAKNDLQKNTDIINNLSKSFSQSEIEYSNIQGQHDQAAYAVSKKTEGVNIAKKELSMAQEALNNSDITNAVADVANKQAAFDAGQKSLSDAIQKIESIEQNLKQQTTVVESAKSQLNSASESLFDANNQLATANKMVDTTTTEVANSKKQLSDAEEAIKNIPQFQATEAMKRSTMNFLQIKKDFDNNKISFAEYHKAELAWGESLKEGLEINTYKNSSTSDKNTEVDLNNLTYEQQVEISQFAATLINNIRRSFGITDKVGTVQVTTHALNIAKELSDAYPEYGKNHYGHYNSKLEEIDKKYGVLAHEALGHIVISEDAQKLNATLPHDEAYYNSVKNLASLKDVIYKQIVGMICDDKRGSYGHTEHILGISDIQSFDKNNVKKRISALGVSTAEFISGPGGMMDRALIKTINFETFPDVPGTNGYPQEVTLPNNVNADDLQKAVATAKDNYEIALNNQSKAIKELSSAKNNQVKAKNNLDNASLHYDSEKNNLNQIRDSYDQATKTKELLEKQVTENLVALNNAKQSLDNFNTIYSEKLTAFRNAQDSFNSKNNELDKLIAELNSKSQQLDLAKQKMDTLNAKLTQQHTLKNSLDQKLQNILKEINANSDLISKLNSNLIFELDNLERNKYLLSNLSALKQQKLVNYEQAQKNLDNELQKLKELTSVASEYENKLTLINQSLHDNGNDINALKNSILTLNQKITDLENYRRELISSPVVLKQLLEELALLEKDYNAKLLSLASAEDELSIKLEQFKKAENRLELAKMRQDNLYLLSKADSKTSKEDKYHPDILARHDNKKISQTNVSTIDSDMGLPPTGEKETGLEGLTVLSGVLAIVGSALLRKKFTK